MCGAIMTQLINRVDSACHFFYKLKAASCQVKKQLERRLALQRNLLPELAKGNALSIVSPPKQRVNGPQRQTEACYDNPASGTGATG
jgi:hypothetical protein